MRVGVVVVSVIAADRRPVAGAGGRTAPTVTGALVCWLHHPTAGSSVHTLNGSLVEPFGARWSTRRATRNGCAAAGGQLASGRTTAGSGAGAAGPGVPRTPPEPRPSLARASPEPRPSLAHASPTPRPSLAVLPFARLASSMWTVFSRTLPESIAVRTTHSAASATGARALPPAYITLAWRASGNNSGEAGGRPQPVPSGRIPSTSSTARSRPACGGGEMVTAGIVSVGADGFDSRRSVTSATTCGAASMFHSSLGHPYRCP